MAGRVGAVPLALLPALAWPIFLLRFETVWPGFLAYHGYLLLVPALHRVTPRQAGFGLSGWRRWLPWSAALAIATIAGFVVVERLFPARTTLPHGWEAGVRLLQPWLPLLLYNPVVNPIAEEYFWRGFVMPRTGLLGSSVLFYVIHASALAPIFGWAALAITLPTLVAGFLWGWMRRATGSLWPAYLTHLAADVAILWVAGRLRQTLGL